MKVLITGHGGFIGHNLKNYILQNTDWEVEGWEWGDPELPEVAGFDWVIHLGAISSTTEQDVEKVLKQNLDFTSWLAHQCEMKGVHMQYASSASVYGLRREFSEDSPGDPRTPYAWSKYLFDRSIDYNRLVFIQGFRYFNVYGNHEHHKQDQASPITKFSYQAENDGAITLFEGSDTHLRDFVAVEDVCRIHVEFINNVQSSGIWNVGTGNPVSFQHVADLLAERYNVPIKYVDIPEHILPSYQAYTCADLTRLEATIGPQQWITVDEWLDKYML